MKDVGNHVKTEIINFLVEKYCYMFIRLFLQRKFRIGGQHRFSLSAFTLVILNCRGRHG